MNNKKNIIIPIITALISTLLVIFSLVTFSRINREMLPLEEAKYDLLVSVSNQERYEAVKENPLVSKDVPISNIVTNKNNIRANLLLTPVIDDLQYTFYNDSLLIEGKLAAGKMVIDNIFADNFDLKVGSLFDVNFMGTIVNTEVSGIFHATKLSQFPNGVAMFELTAQITDLLSPIRYDFVFVNVSNKSAFSSFLSINHYTSTDPALLLNEKRAEKQETITSHKGISFVTSLILIVANILTLVLFMRSNLQEVRVYQNEKNRNALSKLKKAYLFPLFLSGLPFLLIGAILTLIFQGLTTNFGFILLIYFFGYLITNITAYFITKRLSTT